MKLFRSIREFWLRESPKGYLDSSTYLRTDYLVKKVHGLAVSEILEIGCNCGRNLEGLRLSKAYNLFGVELNKRAVTVMQLRHSELYKQAIIINEEIEKVDLDIKKFDLVFTMAVLEHIKDIEFLKRIRTKYFITMEDERGRPRWWYFKRNYKEVFENLGYRQIEEENLGGIIDENFTYRLFINQQPKGSEL